MLTFQAIYWSLEGEQRMAAVAVEMRCILIKLNVDKSSLKMALENILKMRTDFEAHESAKRGILAKAERIGRSAQSSTTADELAEAEKQYTAKRNSTIGLFEKHLGAFYNSVAAAYPSPKDLTQNAKDELYLLSGGYITQPEELNAMWRRNLNPVNPTVLKACARYADHAARKWEGFEFSTDVELYMAAYRVAIRYADEVSTQPDGHKAQLIEGILAPDVFIEYATNAESRIADH